MFRQGISSSIINVNHFRGFNTSKLRNRYYFSNINIIGKYKFRITHYKIHKGLFKILLYMVVFVYFSFTVEAQFGNKMYVAAGLSTSSFFGDNLSTDPLYQRDTTLPGWWGGGFKSPNAGPGLILTMSLDEGERLRMPITFFMHKLSAAQKIPYKRGEIFYLTHTVDLTNLSLGLNYYFVDFTNALAQGFIGLLVRGNFIMNQQLTLKVKDRQGNEIDTSKIYNKPDAFRFGSALLLGADGFLYDKWYIHFYGSIGILNLLGRDNSRGELLNPYNDPPRDEHIVWAYNIALMIKYKL